MFNFHLKFIYVHARELNSLFIELFFLYVSIYKYIVVEDTVAADGRGW